LLAGLEIITVINSLKPHYMQNLGKLYAQWKIWSSASVNRSIFSAAITIAALTFLVKALTALKDIVVVANFGLSDSLDTFLTAYILPLFIISVFGGSFHSAFIPTLTEVRDNYAHEVARRLFLNISLLAISIFTLIIFFLSAADKWLMHMLALGFDDVKLNQTIVLFDKMLPLVFIGGMTMLWGATLNAHKKFMLFAISPIFTPLFIIIGIHASVSNVNVEVLVLATIIGSLVELLLVFIGLYKLNYFKLSKVLIWDEHSKKVVNQYLPMIMGAFVMSGTIIVDQVMASSLPAGSIASLNYAIKVPSFIFTLGATAIGTAIFPFMSKQIVDKSYHEMRRTILVCSKTTLLISIPLVILGIVFSHSIIEILFERQAFTQSNTQLVSEIMQYSLLQIPIYILGTVFARAISVLIGNKVLFYVAVLNIMLNVLFNFILINFMGVAGIALSTSIVYFVSTITLGYILMHEFDKRFLSES
jgi:putative peptidoglycan lipid II flippase